MKDIREKIKQKKRRLRKEMIQVNVRDGGILASTNWGILYGKHEALTWIQGLIRKQKSPTRKTLIEKNNKQKNKL